MKLIVGLGNPGEEYEFTRHNIGFKVIDALCHKNGYELNKRKFEGIFYKTKDFVILKPMTYMNLSGTCVYSMAKYFKINRQDILIIHDDLDLPTGRARMKRKGSSGGQNGLKDIIVKFDSEEIPRLKIGIGKPNSLARNHVLGKFSKTQIEKLNSIKDNLVKGVELFINKDIDEAIKFVNTKLGK